MCDDTSGNFQLHTKCGFFLAPTEKMHSQELTHFIDENVVAKTSSCNALTGVKLALTTHMPIQWTPLNGITF